MKNSDLKLEAEVDQFVFESGCDVSRHKILKPDASQRGFEIQYKFPLDFGGTFTAVVREQKSNDDADWTLSSFIDLGRLETAFDKEQFLYSIANQNAQITDPLKLCIRNGVVSVCLYLDARQINSCDVRDLLGMMSFFAEKYFALAEAKFGLKADQLRGRYEIM